MKSQTKKYVFTGAPSSGKSSIILALEHDFCEIVIRESAEDLIRLYQARGIKKPWELSEFNDKILELQLQREKQIELIQPKRVFIDRGILDGLAYYQIEGREPSELVKATLGRMKTRHYEKVFLIETLGTCKTNEIRKEDSQIALELERLQEQNYRAYGYNPIRIAPKKVDERVRDIRRIILADENEQNSCKEVLK